MRDVSMPDRRGALCALSGVFLAALSTAACAAAGEAVASPPIVEVEPSDVAPAMATSPPQTPASRPQPRAPVDLAVGGGEPCDAADRLWATILDTASERLEAGMNPTGAFGCRRVEEQATFSLELMLEPGKCLAFVAESEVTELDLRLVPVLKQMVVPSGALGNLVLATDSSSGASAAIGAGSCYANPMPLALPVAIEVVATAGRGDAAVAVFAK